MGRRVAKVAVGIEIVDTSVLVLGKAWVWCRVRNRMSQTAEHLGRPKGQKLFKVEQSYSASNFRQLGPAFSIKDAMQEHQIQYPGTTTTQRTAPNIVEKNPFLKLRGSL